MWTWIVSSTTTRHQTEATTKKPVYHTPEFKGVEASAMASVAVPARYRFGRFELRANERRLLAGGEEVRLGAHAFDVLLALLEGGGVLVTKDQLLEKVWGKVVVEENTLQVHVSTLRKVLGAEAIATISGRGYRITLDVSRDTPEGEPATGAKHNLPHVLTSFIGRDKELAELKVLLGRTRFATLTGTGGCGKTRLALQIAQETHVEYPDGAWLVELATLGDAALLPRAVASALGVREQRGKGLAETIAEWVGPRHFLLVLDNAEHLLEACARLAELLLRRCARLVVLVTSRERLGLDGEQIYRVPSLPAAEAARLFVDRARLQQPGLALTDDQDSAAIATICRRLDGIALAIELAAARLRAMSIEELGARLDNRFGILTQGARTSLPRHRTLRALVDWSYDLLDESEKAVLRRASVFAGGWTLDAAERVCGEAIDRRSVLDLLTALEDKSLIVAEVHRGATRFSMLETVRDFALDRLRESGEEVGVRSRHVDFLVQVALELQDARQGDDERRPKLERVARDIDNFRSALAWCADNGRNDAGLRLASRLKWHWRISGSFAEGRGWLERFLRCAPAGYPLADLAQALNTAGVVAYLQTDYPASQAWHREALAIWRGLGETRFVSAELNNLGIIAMAQGDDAIARGHFEEALVLARETGDLRGIALRLQNLGILAGDMGDYARAEALLEESVAVGRGVGAWAVAEARKQLGRVKHAQGDLRTARELLTEALDGERQFGDRAGTAQTLIWLAAVSHDYRDVAAAKAQIQEALTTLHAIGDHINLAVAMETFGGLCLDLGKPSAAVRQWGCAERVREEFGLGNATARLARRDLLVAAARAALGDDAAFDRAWRDGRAWSVAEAVKHAIDQ